MAPKAKQVVNTQQEQEDEEDIVIEFEGNFDLEDIDKKQLQLFGLDTDNPVLRIDSKYYKIDIKDSVGTRMIYEKKDNGELKYCTKTDKIATARRVMVKQK